MSKAMLTQPLHRDWLTAHSRALLDFGRDFPSPRGGAGWLSSDGTRDDTQPVFTWITSRMLHVYGMGAITGVPGCRPLALAAMGGLAGVLHDDVHGGWFASVAPDGAPDDSKSAYAHAFVVLGASTALVAELPGALELLTEALDILDTHFYEPGVGLLRDSWSRDWTELDAYRGINANMHAVEALMAAADALAGAASAAPAHAETSDTLRERALAISSRVIAWAKDNDWRIPEHFDSRWVPQLSLNIEAPNDPFKPYGATVGHGIEWARLLLHLDASLGHNSPGGLIPAAVALYDRAIADGWECASGTPGLVYTTDWSGVPVVRSRMHWVAAEAIGAASALFRATGQDRFAGDYARWWDHVAEFFIDHDGGSWHHELSPENRPGGGVWAGKPDIYHAFQATLIPRVPLTPALASALAAGLLDTV